jgi:hypothetical protein
VLKIGWVWWYPPLIPVFERLRQEDCKFQARLGYIVRIHLKKKKKSHMHTQEEIVTLILYNFITKELNLKI